MSERWLESQHITPTCRANRTTEGAWDEAVRRLREIYDAQVKHYGGAVTMTLTISRKPADGVPRYVLEAAGLADSAPSEPKGGQR